MQIRSPDKNWLHEKLAGLGVQLSQLEINELERQWLLVSVAMIGLFVGAIVVTAVSHGIHPPGHV